MVSIDMPLVQHRVLTDLPPVTPTALHALVARGSSRFFRQNGHPLVTGAVWSSTTGTNVRVATAAAIDGALAQAIVDGAIGSALLVEDIVPAQGPTGLSLVPEGERRRRRHAEWRQVGRLAAATLMLWLLVLTGLGARLWLESHRVETELSRLVEPRDALIRARQAMGNASAMVEAMQGTMVRREAVERWLAAMAGVLPDSAYLEEAEFGVNVVGSLRGRAAQPQQVLTAMQKIPDMGAAALQLTPGDPSTWPGFTISFGTGRVP
jgi:hypothetical protein